MVCEFVCTEAQASTVGNDTLWSKSKTPAIGNKRERGGKGVDADADARYLHEPWYWTRSTRASPYLRRQGADADSICRALSSNRSVGHGSSQSPGPGA